MQIEVVLVESGEPVRRFVTLPAGATVADAISASGVLQQRLQGLEGLAIAVFGRHEGLTCPLEAGDRIELLAPLTVDPKVARQRRAEHRRRESGELRWLPGRH